MDNEPLNPPKPGAIDRAYAVVRGLVASVPLVGGVAGEVFAMVLAAPLDKRREEWMQAIAERLHRLEKDDPKRFAELPSDPTFTSVLLQASQAAYRSNRQEKTRLLRNAVTQSAAGVSIESDFQVMFVRYVDEMTAGHVAVLASIAKNEKALAYVEAWEALCGAVCTDIDVTMSREQFQLLCQDLRSRLLVRISDHLKDFKDLVEGPSVLTTEGGGRPMLRVTDIGRQFLTFVDESD